MLEYLFGTVGFMPHGMCLLWRPDIVIMHVTADILIFASYLAIALCIHRFVRARPEFRYSRIALLSAAFVGGCGITHLFGAVSLWWPAYGAQAVLKIVVALISLAAAVAIWRGFPDLVKYPSFDEIEARRIAEQRLRTSETELKAALATAKSAEKTKVAFLAAMSHDLRTPLNAILGFGEALSMGIFGAMANAKQSEYVQHIRDSASHLRELIDDLLDLSSVEAEVKPLEREHLPVRNIMQDIARNFEVSASFIKRETRVVVSSETDHIFSEERVLRRIMHNLLSNSAKYAPDSSLIDVVVRRVHDCVEISVIDDGPGFPEGDADMMRAPFARGEPSDDGLGLGLSIVDTLVRQHGGVMKLSNESGRGAKVTITFPAERSFDNPLESAARQYRHGDSDVLVAG